jgi:predicted 2-oxoglutarate/Fe(II)-dependent dioxygenase YbiX
MKKNLEDYVFVMPLLNQKLCNKVIEELQNVKWKIHTFYAHRDRKSETVSNGNDLDSSYEAIPSNHIIMKCIWKAIHKYIVENLKFSWFPGWEGYTKLKYNRYNKNKLMAEHCDHIHDMFEGKVRGIPILTVLISLNNNYKGGELIFFQNKEYKLKPGEVIIFPSNFLYPHKVMPITEGTRYTCISWVY